MSPLSPPITNEDQQNLVVPNTPEDVIASRANKTLKYAFDESKTLLFMHSYFVAEIKLILSL